MAEAMASNQDIFMCPVCLDLMKHPVTLNCGHNFCLDCIGACWDKEDEKGVYSCPQCRETFTPRPVLKKNHVFSELVDQMRKSRIQTAAPVECAAGPGDVACDVCTSRKLKAVKSCLECLVSYCDTHLRVHDEAIPGRNHTMIDATGQLQERICPRHKKVFEIFCRTDQSCICYLCMVDDHKGHDTITATAEWSHKKDGLGNSQRRCQQIIQLKEKELQELRKAVKTLKSGAQTAVEESERMFTEMIRSIERRCSEVTELIRAQEKAEVSRAEGLLKRLEKEIAELKRRDAEMKQLSLTQDAIHFLKNIVSITGRPYSTISTSVTFSQSFSLEPLKKSVSALKTQLEEKLDSIFKQEIVKISAAGGIDREYNRVNMAAHAEKKNEESKIMTFPCFSGTKKKTRTWEDILEVIANAKRASNGRDPLQHSARNQHGFWGMVCKHLAIANTETTRKKINQAYRRHMKKQQAVDQQEQEPPMSDDAAAEYHVEGLGQNQWRCQQMIQLKEKELQELRKAVETLKSGAQTAVKESEKMFTDMIRSIERRRSEVTELIRAQEKAEVSWAEGLLKRLEQEIAELKRTDAEMNQLSLIEDPIHFLKNIVSITGRPYSTISTSVTLYQNLSLEPLKESVSALKMQLEHKFDSVSAAAKKNIQIVKNIQLSDGQALIAEPVTREDFLKYSCHFTLDPNTANTCLHLSEGDRRVEDRPEKLPYPDHPDRFDCNNQVLCREGVSARCYWEVEWSGEVDLAVSYKSISRKGDGDECGFGCNDQSWCLDYSSSSSSFWHHAEETKLPLVASSRIGVYVDHRAGTLAFYSISGDTMTLLHRVHTTFTHPLYPGFGLDDESSVKLL
ncbi:tripartite motif-containing protein 16-like [Engraulis encrasicolus]|uniref:tripartite motif-containing protein 16-like n=1 Tax=Engraulis encrasicolus TaxID=184585 RepID=UPI002FD2E010